QISSFWMDRHEVTVGRFRACVADGTCTPPGDATGLAYYRDVSNQNRPMVDITVEAMRDFCRFDGGRLPTDTEWERAARGLEGRTYPWCEAEGCQFANWAECSTPALADVGSFPAGASPEGVLDLIGNAQETTSDRWIDGGWSAYGSAG